MKKIHKDALSHLGCDYARNNDYYVDPSTGKLYKRHVVLSNLRGKGKVDCVEESFVEMVEGNPVHADGFGPVLSCDN